MTYAASVVIPARDHVSFLPRAIGAALSQDIPVEVIVVDDGSVDETPEYLRAAAEGVGRRLRFLRLEESVGPAAARNVGVEAAETDFLTFLDADDTIAPSKVRKQLDAVQRTGAGWALCDVDIVSEWRMKQGRPRGTYSQLASQRYSYGSRPALGRVDYVYNELVGANIVPLHSPLVSRRALEEAGPFCPEAGLEDWDLWTRLSCVAKAAYVPEVLAAYMKQATGRHMRFHEQDPAGARVLKLNLGCGAPDRLSWHPLPGFVNLDRHTVGWTYESGLPDFKDGTVDAITVSHSLYAVEERRWPAVMAEMYRVLKPGGVVRITEDDAVNARDPRRRGGWRGSEPFATVTYAGQTLAHLRTAGFQAREVPPDATQWRDRSLIQHFHGDPPDVFHVEGVKS